MREDIARNIHWPWIIWLVSVTNPLMMTPQLWKIWQTGETAGISLIFLALIAFVQSGFSLHGFFTRDRFIMASNGLAALMSLATLLSTIYLRS